MVNGLPLFPEEQELVRILQTERARCLWIVYAASPEIFSRYFPNLINVRENLHPTRFLRVGRYTAGIIGVNTSIVAIPGFPGDFTRDELVFFMERIQAFALAVGARGVALAGIIPGRFYRYGIPMDPPIVSGDLGAVYTIVETLQDALRMHGLALSTRPVRVLGYGYIGQRCIEHLRQLGCTDLVAIERRLRGTYQRRGVIFTNSLDAIRQDDWVVFTAGGGNEIDVARLPRIFGVDDMYPPFSVDQLAMFEAKESVIFQAALHAEGVVSNLPIEQFAEDQFAGCMAQGLLQAAGVDTSRMTQGEFDITARARGIRSSLA
ncbi:MAG TPA: hypothetical protein VFE94_04105 [Candidatus Paceibacterota bacterium]|nr:hypothetical protein [Candidatus Paceibacterota bacterium]